MFLCVGLGNPSSEYALHRHNVGFMVIDSLADHYGFPKFSTKFQGLSAKGVVDAHPVLLFKPLTFMNNSGLAVRKILDFYKLDSQSVIVFHDDLDLTFGTLRVKCGGGHAGHNGLKSLDSMLGTPEYWRVRIGIGRPPDRNLVHNYVLSPFAHSEKPVIQTLRHRITLHMPVLLEGDSVSFVKNCIESLLLTKSEM